MVGGWNRSVVEKQRPNDHLEGQANLDVASETGWAVAKKRTSAEGSAAASPVRTRKPAEMIIKTMKLKSAPQDGGVSRIYLLIRAADMQLARQMRTSEMWCAEFTARNRPGYRLTATMTPVDQYNAGIAKRPSPAR